ncbi:MAG: YdcF family protein [Arthrobacter sp.]|uniref:YdcF family protein n=1 Tax=Arthrobacter TaxID=1663 RepID=UPI00264AF4F3|nr:YdcF family protein [Micrococcaceae bacterium]MDN5822720.1 YdcF family protein [Micrococcaceae bacterium]MDN5878184.1 YdcF family protein [Micrococcaceae bacterium]MDN5886703.1 YdcF family protein [Micrococcaceae bacterium]MDN5904524.1 YdcF family protein [Micrococcaceae bacterium]
MSFLIIAALLGLLYVWLRRKDRRMLRNGVVLVAAIWFALTGATALLSSWSPVFDYITLGILALVPLAVIVLAGFLIANGLTMMRSEGRRLGNLLTLVLGIAMLVLPVLALLLVLTLQPLLVGLAFLLFFLCGYLGVVFVIFLAYAVAYGRMEHDIHPEAITILGSRLIGGKVPPLLASRLDKAVELHRQAPDPKPVLIPSGGQGHDESRTEGEGMAEYLYEAGIPAADVVPENQAKTTRENLRFSREVQNAAGRPGPLLVVTNNYHVLRAALLARKYDVDAQVVGSPTARYYVPSAFLREFVAIINEHRVLNAVLCLPFFAISGFIVLGVLAGQ